MLLWALEGSLDSASSELIGERGDAVFVSAATIWEIELKQAQGRLTVPAEFLSLIERTGFDELAVTFEHAVEAARLPALHLDRFDRMLIAQARVERLVLATADASMARYDVEVVKVGRA